MVRLNKVYGNLMVDVKPTNAKLVQRAVALTTLATGVTPERARSMLDACDFEVKTAIVAIKLTLDAAGARDKLAAAKGSVHGALRGGV